MSRIDILQQIMYEVTGIMPDVLRDISDYEYSTNSYITILYPSYEPIDDPYVDVEVFEYNILTNYDAEVTETIETLKNRVLKGKTDHPSGYKYSYRYNFTVDNHADFSTGETISGDTSSATGVIFKIESNTIYIKDTIGEFQNSETITNGGAGSTTITSEPTLLVYPFYLDLTEWQTGRNGYGIKLLGSWAI